MAIQHICDVCGKIAKDTSYEMPLHVTTKIYNDNEIQIGSHDRIIKKTMHLCDEHCGRIGSILRSWQNYYRTKT